MVWDYDEPPFRGYIVSGEALESWGFVSNDTVDYMGMMVYGLMWSGSSIWSPTQAESIAPTIWTDATPAVTTIWTDFFYA